MKLSEEIREDFLTDLFEHGFCFDRHDLQMVIEKIEQLEQEKEQMMNCQNCKHEKKCMSLVDFCNLERWELK